GVDIGNSSTEVSLADVSDQKEVSFVGSGIAATTGIKGTKQNLLGIKKSIDNVIKKTASKLTDVDLITINEATPVIGDVAMETITETVITESTMIGHNPETPGGVGTGTGYTVTLDELAKQKDREQKYIVLVRKEVDFADVAKHINQGCQSGLQISAAIMQNDDAVLVDNRLENKIPIVDEVALIDKVPLHMQAAVEVAAQGRVVSQLSNPYGIATLFGLSAQQTKNIVPIARALIGNRSAVVIKTPSGHVKARTIPAGSITILGDGKKAQVDVGTGADEIMQKISQVKDVQDIQGASGTNVGGMLENV